MFLDSVNLLGGLCLVITRVILLAMLVNGRIRSLRSFPNTILLNKRYLILWVMHNVLKL